MIDTAEVEEVGILLEFIEGIAIPAVLIIAMENGNTAWLHLVGKSLARINKKLVVYRWVFHEFEFWQV